MRAKWLILAVAAALAVRAAAGRQVDSREDLSGVKLPNGVSRLPSHGAPDVRKLGGYIFRFRDASYHLSPFDAKGTEPGSADELRGAIRRADAGDLTYTYMQGGSLVAWSGRIADLGEGYLHELSGKKLDRPPLAYSKLHRDGRGGSPYVGYLEGVAVGHRYLVETTGGHFAIVRLLRQGGRTATVQWVYQPNGGRKFAIANSPLVPLEALETPAQRPTDDPRQLPSQPRSAPPTIRELRIQDLRAIRSAIATHTENRRALLRALIRSVTEGDGPGKVAAIKALGELRATGAAPALAREIAWFDRWTPRSEATIAISHPCVPALIEVGLPGAGACLAELATCPSETALQKRRLKLLALVVLRVYGDKLAKVVLADRRDAAQTDRAKENFQAALASIPGIEGWR
jgi:hypothetical protein